MATFVYLFRTTLRKFGKNDKNLTSELLFFSTRINSIYKSLVEVHLLDLPKFINGFYLNLKVNSALPSNKGYLFFVVRPHALCGQLWSHGYFLNLNSLLRAAWRLGAALLS